MNIENLKYEFRILVMAAIDFTLSDTGEFYVNQEVQNAFDQNGYIIVRGLLTAKEVTKLKDHMEMCKDIHKHSYGREDGMGRKSNLSLWNIAGDDVPGMVARYTQNPTKNRQIKGRHYAVAQGFHDFFLQDASLLKDSFMMSKTFAKLTNFPTVKIHLFQMPKSCRYDASIIRRRRNLSLPLQTYDERSKDGRSTHMASRLRLLVQQWMSFTRNGFCIYSR